MEIIYKRNLDAKQRGLGLIDRDADYKWQEVQVLLLRVE